MQLRSRYWLATSALALASCGGDEGRSGAAPSTPDPLVARALNDPIMTDPDLVHRNQAFAALTIRHDHALPPLIATSDNAEAAREAARRELLETGAIAELPVASGASGGEALAPGMTAQDIIKATGAPSACSAVIEEGIVWAARMPEPASVMPHGMTMQAAGADTSGCTIRIVRYITPVDVEDALSYHNTRAERAGMTVQRLRDPEAILDAERGSQHLKVYARPGLNGTSAVDLVYWRR